METQQGIDEQYVQLAADGEARDVRDAAQQVADATVQLLANVTPSDDETATLEQFGALCQLAQVSHVLRNHAKVIEGLVKFSGLVREADEADARA